MHNYLRGNSISYHDLYRGKIQIRELTPKRIRSDESDRPGKSRIGKNIKFHLYPTLYNSGILRGDDHCHQAVSTSRLIERTACDGSDIGGDDHMGASATRCAVTVLDGRCQNKGCCRSCSWCGRTVECPVDNDSGSRKGCRRQVRHRPRKTNVNLQ